VRQWLSLLHREQLRHLVDDLVHLEGGRVHQLRALAAGHCRPGGKRLARRLDGSVDVGGRSARDLTDDFAIRGIADLDRLATLGIDELSADEHLGHSQDLPVTKNGV
jgi:hypothetical protein